jgi:hypothetical protein
MQDESEAAAKDAAMKDQSHAPPSKAAAAAAQKAAAAALFEVRSIERMLQPLATALVSDTMAGRPKHGSCARLSTS